VLLTAAGQALHCRPQQALKKEGLKPKEKGGVYEQLQSAVEGQPGQEPLPCLLIEGEKGQQSPEAQSGLCLSREELDRGLGMLL